MDRVDVEDVREPELVWHKWFNYPQVRLVLEHVTGGKAFHRHVFLAQIGVSGGNA